MTISELRGQGGWWRCWGNAQASLTSILIATTSELKTRRLEVLGQCARLAHLDLAWHNFGAEEVGRLAGVLGQCASLAHLDLAGNNIGAEGTRRLVVLLGTTSELRGDSA